ncbi:MAG: FAD binding domain-containing protein [Herpetosiphonaceae bacterium]|nr:FAD binding domain-containing protein [Herpetosiphonaceae bacterium]
MWQTYLQPTTLAETLQLLEQHAGAARLVAGGTDVLVELSRGIKPTATLIDLSRLEQLKYIRQHDGTIQIGGLATHNDVVAAAACVEGALPLAQACWEVGAPQIRTRGTVAGNLITASPANDTITPLLALDAAVVLASAAGERVVPLREFYLGVRRTVMQPGELLREIRLPALRTNQRGLFLKLGLRRAQAIAVINVAFVLTLDGDVVSAASITLGCLAPTIVHAPSAESFLVGRRLTEAVCARAGELACGDVRPIDDLRGSAGYRLATLASLVAHGLSRIAAGTQAEGWLSAPILLENGRHQPAGAAFDGTTIHATINGQPRQLISAHAKSLLDALRDDAGLTGTKEGCAEGECGACTVWLNGQAVMACLVPAPQAHNGTLTTIEGLADGDELHPLQAAFIKHAAVQCGYCIPGMLMAGAKLLEEEPHPDHAQAQVALSGNICRCTGYRKILDAVVDAGGAQ